MEKNIGNAVSFLYRGKLFGIRYLFNSEGETDEKNMDAGAAAGFHNAAAIADSL